MTALQRQAYEWQSSQKQWQQYQQQMQQYHEQMAQWQQQQQQKPQPVAPQQPAQQSYDYQQQAPQWREGGGWQGNYSGGDNTNDPAIQDILREEAEFEQQYSTWRQQYNDWKDQNKGNMLHNAVKVAIIPLKRYP